MTELLNQFHRFLSNPDYNRGKSLSKVSIKNYLSDVRRFLHWLNSPDLTLINSAKAAEYVSFLEADKIPTSTITRHLSSLRRFFTFLAITYQLPEVSVVQGATLKSHTPGVTGMGSPGVNELESEFKSHLLKQGKSTVTIKNYLSDVHQFLNFVQSQHLNLSQLNSAQLVNLTTNYKSYLSSISHTPATVSRHLSTLKGFFEYAHRNHYAISNPLAPATEVYGVSPFVTPVVSGSKIYDLRSTISRLPRWLMAVNLAFIFFALGTLAFYRLLPALTHQEPESIAINGKVAGVATLGGSGVTFGSALDENFNFRVKGVVESSQLISTTTDEPPLTVSSSELVKNLNVDLLDGHHAASPAKAGDIPFINSTGQLLVDSGLTISAPSQVLSTTFGSDGDITLNPDGQGSVNVLTSNSTGPSFLVNNAQLKSGSLIEGRVGNNNTGYDFLHFLSGSTLVNKFAVSATGNVFLAGTLSDTNATNIPLSDPTHTTLPAGATSILGALTNGGTGNGLFTDGGSYLYPTNYESIRAYDTAGNNYIDFRNDGTNGLIRANSGDIRLQNNTVIEGNFSLASPNNTTRFGGIVYSWPTTQTAGYFLQTDGSGGLTWAQAANYWQRNNHVIAPAEITDDLAIGGTSTASAKFHVAADTGNLTTSGTTTFNTQTYTWPSTGQSNNFILATNGSGGLSWADPNVLTAGSNYWAEANGTLYPKNSTEDLLVGGSATTSAKFAFVNVASGVPTASVSAITNNNALYLTANGTLATTNKQSLILGSSSTGNIEFFSTANTLSSSGNLTLAGAITLPNSNTLTGVSNFLRLSQGLSVGGSDTYYLSSTGALNASLVNVDNLQLNGNTLNTTSGNLTLDSFTGTTDINDILNVSGLLTANAGVTIPSGQVLTVSGTVDSNLVPTTDSTYNLGSATNYWQDLYVNNIYAPATGVSGYWQRNSGVVSPAFITDDLTIGGTATASAKFQVFGDTGNATSAGNLTLTGTAPTIASRNFAALTLGDTQTGNIILNPGTGKNVGIGTTSPTSQVEIKSDNAAIAISSVDVTNIAYLGRKGLTGSDMDYGKLQLKGASGGINLVLQGNGESYLNGGNVGIGDSSPLSLFTVGSGDLFQVDSTGSIVQIDGVAHSINDVSGDLTLTSASNTISLNDNVTFAGTTTLNSQTYTWPAGGQSSNYILSTNGSGSLSWSDPAALTAATIYWAQGAGILYPKNTTVDVLIGSDATSTAKFAFTNVASGVPTASISGTSGSALSLTGDGYITTTNAQTLTLGNTDTGNINFYNSNNYITSAGAFAFAGNGTIGGTLTLPNSNTLTGVAGYTQFSNGVSVGGGTTYYINNLGTANLNALTTAGLITANAGVTIPSGQVLTVSGTVDSNLVPTTTSTYDLGSPTNYWNNLYANNIYAPATGVSGYWQRNAGALAPAFLSDDLLVGGIATSTAKFQVFGDTGNATSSGNLTLNGTAPTIATRLAKTLTIGDSQSGNIVLHPGTGIISLDQNSQINTAGTLLIDSTGTLSLNTTNNSGLTTGTGLTTLGGNATINGTTLSFAGATGLIDSTTGTLSLNTTNNQAITTGTGLTTLGGALTAAGLITANAGVTIPSGQVLTVSGTVTSNLVPTTTSTYDLGSPTNYWNNLYANNIYAPATGVSGYWQRNSGVVSPAFITDDLSIGGTATSTALFQISGTTGAATSSSTLTFRGTTDPKIDVLNGENFGIRTSVGGDSGLSERLTILNNGNVGIGVTNPSSFKLDVLGVIRAGDSAGTVSAPQLRINGGGGNGVDAILRANSWSSHYGEFGYDYDTYNATVINSVTNNTSGAVRFLSNGTDTLTISAGGNVGVGTTTPTAKLDVVGDASASGSLVFRSATPTVDILNGSNLSFATSVGGDSDLSSVFTINNNGDLSSTGNLTLTGNDRIIDMSGTGTLGLNTTTNRAITTGTGLFTTGGALTSTGLITANAGLTIPSGQTLTVASGFTTLNSQAYTWPSGGQSTNYILSTNGSGGLSWADPNVLTAGTNYWNQALGALYPKNTTVDVLFGSDATSTAKFAFTNVDSGVPTASISAVTNNNSLYLTANGLIAATNAQSLTLGDADTGRVSFYDDNSFITSTGNLTLAGTLTLPNSSILFGDTTYLRSTRGLAFGANETYYINSSGTGNLNALTTAGTLTSNGTTNLNGDITLGDAVTDNLTFTGRVAQDSDIIPIGTTGTNDLGAALLPWDNIYVDNIISGGTIAGFWQRNSGVLAPQNITDDLTIGGNSTATAKFQVYGDTGNLKLANSETIGNSVDDFISFTGVGGASNTDLRFNLDGTNPTIDSAASTAINFGDDVTLAADNRHLYLGASNDLDLYHDGTNSIIKTTTGDLYFQADNDTTNYLALSTGGGITSLTATGTNNFSVFSNGDFIVELDENGDGTNKFAIKDSSNNEIVTFAENQATIAIPTQFTSAGDVSIAYDLLFTNQTASYIKSNAPFYIQTGESFESNDLTLQTYNKGNVIVDSEALVANNAATVSTQLVIGTSTAPADISSLYLTNSSVYGKALAIFNQTESSDIFTASASGVTKLTLSNTGNLSFNQASTIDATGALSLNTTNNQAITTGTGDFTAGGNLLVNGNTTLGDATTDTVTYTARAASHFIPSVTSTYDLGASTLTWRTLYVDNIIMGGGAVTSGFWQRPANTGLLAPQYITDDLAVGGNSTASSKFQIIGTTGDIYTANNTIDWTLNDAVDALNIDGNTLSIDALNERVGIGTAAPVAALEVVGSQYFSGAANRGIFLQPSSDTDSQLDFNFGSNLTSGTGYFRFNRNTNTSGNSGIQILKGNNTTTANAIISGTGNTYFAADNGSVGIGTANPLALLHVSKATGSELRLDTVGGTNANSTLSFYENAVSRGSIYWDGTANDFVWTSSTGDISLTPANNVGIGTVSPVAKLDLSGAVTGKALAIFNETGDQAIFTASASGVPVFTIGRTGILALNQNSQINTAGTLLIDSTGALSLNTTNNQAITTGTGQITLAGNVDATNGLDVTTANLTVGGANFSVDQSNGNITTAGTLTLPNSNTLTGVASYTQFSNGVSVGGATTYYLDASGNLNANAGTFASTLTVKGANELRLNDGDDSNYTGFQAPTTVTSNAVYILPPADGTVNQVLSTNGGATLSWVDINAIAGATESASLWTLVGGTGGLIAPQYNYYSVAIGATATDTAKLYFDAVNGNSSQSGTLTFNGNDSLPIIASRRFETLQLGDSLTGNLLFTTGAGKNIQFYDANTTIDSSGNLTLAGNGVATSGYFQAGNLRLGGSANTITSTTGNLILDSAANLVLNDSTVQFANGSATIDVYNSAADNTTLTISNSNAGTGPTGLANLTVEGQIRPGSFTSSASYPNPEIEGGIIYDSTDNNLLFWNGSAWTAVGSGSSSGGSNWTETLGVIYPTKNWEDLAIGGTSTDTAKFHVNASTGTISIENPLDTSYAHTIVATDNTFPANDRGNLYLSSGGNVLSGHGTKVIINPDLQVNNGNIRDVNGNVHIQFANTDADTFLTNIGNKLSVNATNLTTDAVAKFQVNGSVTGKALAIFNNSGDQDMLAASLSGVTNFRIDNGGQTHSGKYWDIDNESYFLDPSASGANVNLAMAAGNFTSATADGASAIAFKLDTTNTLSTDGAKLLSIQNNTTEYFYVDKDGNVWAKGNIYSERGFGMSMKNIGSALSQYDLVVINTTEDSGLTPSDGVTRMTATTSAYAKTAIGVVQEACAYNAICKVTLQGKTIVNVADSTNRGDYIFSSDTAGKATSETKQYDGLVGVATSTDASDPYQVEMIFLHQPAVSKLRLADKNRLHDSYREAAADYQATSETNYYNVDENTRQGIYFDIFADQVKADSANTTTAISTDKQQAGLWGGRTFNTTNTDVASNAYLGSNTVNKVIYYDRSKDSSAATQVSLGLDPNWYNGVTLTVATTSASFSPNAINPNQLINPNLSTSYNGSLVKATGRYSADAKPIYLTIKTPTTFDWTNYTGQAATGVTITPGTAQSLGTTGVSVTFTDAYYNVGDVFKVASWFTEPTGSTRGNKQQFPLHSYIIATASGVNIIDADTGRLWMRFAQGTNYALGADTNNDPSSVSALNGKLYVSTNGSSGTGLYTLDFVHNALFRQDATDYRLGDVGLAGRNGTVNYNVINTTNILADAIANDVSSAVIPNQPTGLVTVSGWGVIQGSGSASNLVETVYFPYKFASPPSVTQSFAGRSSAATGTVSLADCDTTGAISVNQTESRSITTDSFDMAMRSDYTASVWLCYIWSATGVVAPQQLAATATDTAVTVINDTDSTSLSYSDVAGDDYNAVKLTSGGRMYALNETQAQLEKWRDVATNTTSELAGTPDEVWDETTTPALTATAPTIQTTPSSLYVTERTSTINPISDTVYVGTDLGLSVIQTNDDWPTASDGNEDYLGSIKYYTTSYVTEEMVSGVLGTWPLNGSGAIADNANLADASLNANVFDVDNANGTGFTYASGVRGTGVTLDGVDDFACSDANNDNTCDADTDYSFTTGSFSISTWFKHSASISGTDVLVSRMYTTTPAAGDGFAIFMDSNGKMNFAIDDDTTWTAYTSFDDLITSPLSYADDTWHQVTAVKDGISATYLYIDGYLVASDTSLTAIASISDSATILGVGADCSVGAACATGANFWDGSIDEPTISGIVLNPTKIKQLYTNGYRALQGHTTTLGSGAADTNQELAGSTDTVSAVQLDTNRQFLYVGTNDATNGRVTKIDVTSDTNVKTFDKTANTPTGGTLLANNDVSSLAVSSQLEAVASATTGATSMALNSNGDATSGTYYSDTVTLPDNISSLFIWTNENVDSSCAACDITVSASNDGGTNYKTGVLTNSDTNQTYPENEYFFNFDSPGNSLKVKIEFARDTNKASNVFITRYGAAWFQEDDVAGSLGGGLFTASDASVANGGYVEVAHNQNTNDLVVTGWFYDSLNSRWQEIDDQASDDYNIVQVDANTVRLYNNSGSTQNLRLDVSTGSGGGGDSGCPGCVSLAPLAADVVSDSNRNAIWINQTTSNGRLLRLQNSGVDKFTVGWDGHATLSGSLTIGSGSLHLSDDATGSHIKSTSGSLSLQVGGTTAGSAGTSSITLLDSAGTTRGRFDTAVKPSFLGDGSEGAVTISASLSMNADNLGSGTDGNTASYADGIAYKVDPATATTSGTAVNLYDTPSGLVAGDEVLLINLRGVDGDNADVGNYEFLTISSISSNTVNFTTSVTRSYDGTTPDNQLVAIQRIPQFTTVTVNSGGTLTATAFDGLTPHVSGTTAYYTGIVAFRATGAVTVNSGGSISANGLGYRGGAGGTASATGSGGKAGEWIDGYVGQGADGNGAENATYGGGRAGDASDVLAPNNGGARGGGGGGGANGAGGGNNDGGGGGGGGGYAGGGGGGGGGADGGANAALTHGAGDSVGGISGGGGGGGQTDSAASGGIGGDAGSSGADSSGVNGGDGGPAGSGAIGGSGGGGATSQTDGGGGGGGGGGLYGDAQLFQLFPGSGGGGGGSDVQATPVAGSTGGAGGGIVFITGSSVSSSLGSITSTGADGTAAASDGGAGGAGSGGAILIVSDHTFLGSAKVTALGGTGGARGGTGAAAGNGGAGRIAVHSQGGAGGVNGTTSPALVGNQLGQYVTSAQNGTYGTLYIGATNTSAADVAEHYPSNDSLIPGEVVVFDSSTNGYVKRSTKASDPSLIGIVSTDPGVILGQGDAEKLASDSAKTYPIALSGRVPVYIDPASEPILVGDYLTSSNTPGMATKATKPGAVIARALESWNPGGSSQITVFTHLSYYDPTWNNQLTDQQINESTESASPIQMTAINEKGELVKLAELATLPDPLASQSSLIAENSTDSGLLNPLVSTDSAQTATNSGTMALDTLSHLGQLALNKLSTLNLDIFGLLRAKDIQTNSLATNLISPLATGSAILINGDASISGTLYAADLQSPAISTLSSNITALKSDIYDLSTATESAHAYVENLFAQAADRESYLRASVSDLTSTSSALLSSINDLKSTIYTHLDISSISADTANFKDFLAQNSVQTNTLSTISNDDTLFIQPSGTGYVNILAGVMTLNSDGQVTINGNLEITGDLIAQSITTQNLASVNATISGLARLNEVSAATLALRPNNGFAKLLSVYDEAGNEVGSVDASGSANFTKLQIEQLVIAAPASNSADLSSTTATSSSNASVGTGTIPAGSTELVIDNSKIDNSTLIYLTPISDTRNQVLYVKAKSAGQGFTVAISSSIDQPISFNYWLIKTN